MTRSTWMLGLLLAVACTTAAKGPGSAHPRNIPQGHTGAFTTWWNDDRPKEIGEYRNGLRHGRVRTFHSSDGSLATDGHYEQGVATGELRTYYPGGQLMRSEFATDSVLDGTRVEYYADGTRRSEAVFVRGFKDGPERTWFANGQMSSEGHWTAGLPSHAWRHWNEEGVLLSEEFYWVRSGKPAGYLETVFAPEGYTTAQTLMRHEPEGWLGWVTLWHPNGRQAGILEYRDGKRHGRDVAWDRAGIKVSEGTWEDDVKHGLWKRWTDGGRELQVMRYEKGEEVTVDEGDAAAGGGGS